MKCFEPVIVLQCSADLTCSLCWFILQDLLDCFYLSFTVKFQIVFICHSPLSHETVMIFFYGWVFTGDISHCSVSVVIDMSLPR